MQGRLALPVFVLLAGCTADGDFETEDITLGDYGDRWPLTVGAAVLACEPGGVPTVTVQGTTYGLYAADDAKVRAHFRLQRILAADSDGKKKDPGVLLRDALALCE